MTLKKLPTLPDERPISPTRCARELKHSPNIITGVVEQNFQRLLIITFPDSNRIKIFKSQIQYCLENPLPEEEAEQQKKFNELGDFMAEDVDEEFDEYEAIEDIEFRIYKNGSLKEKWGRSPTDQEIEENFGPGKYRVVAFNVERELVLKARCVDITDASGLTSASPIREMATVMESAFDRMQKINQTANTGGNGNTEVYKMLFEEMRVTNQSLLELMKNQTTPAPAPAGGGFDLETLIATFKTLQEAGSIFNPQGTNQYDLIKEGMDRIGGVLEEAIPGLVESYKMRSIDTSDLNKLPNQEFVPVSSPQIQHIESKGGEPPANTTESQRLKAIELDIESPGEGESEI